MYVLDSSVIIELINNTERAGKILREIGDLPIITTSVCLHEIMSGTFNKQEEFIMNGIITNMEILPHTKESAKIGAEIFKELKTKGNMVNEFDILIASICEENKATLITLDKDFSKIKRINSKIL